MGHTDFHHQSEYKQTTRMCFLACLGFEPRHYHIQGILGVLYVSKIFAV